MTNYLDQLAFLGDNFGGRYVDGDKTIVQISGENYDSLAAEFDKAFPDFETVPVKYSYEELSEVCSRIVDHMKSESPYIIASAGIYRRGNCVVVEVVDLTGEIENSIRKNVIDSPALEFVNVKSLSEGTALITAGGPIEKQGGGSSSSCVAVLRNGQGGFITHAHNRFIGDVILKSGELAGTIVAQSPGNDASFVHLSPNSSATNLNLATGQAISVYGTAEEGDLVKIYGRNGMKEGKVIKINVTYYIRDFADSQGQLYAVQGDIVDYYADLGDSGGVVVPSGSVRVMLGLQSVRNDTDLTSKFTNAADILSALNAILIP